MKHTFGLQHEMVHDLFVCVDSCNVPYFVCLDLHR